MEAEAVGETLAKSSSLAQDKLKKGQDPDAKTLKEVALQGVNSSMTGGARGKGFRVSENGGGVGQEGAGSEVVVIEDSEMNGASTLLKMQQSLGEGLGGLGSVLDAIDNNEMTGDERKGPDQDINGHSSDANEGGPNGKIVGLSQGGGGGDDDVGDGWHEFCEGDFVWGKIRSHPWWPGRVYDPLNASDYANKVKQGDKTLVAYFGDSTFAWCNPSQLKPLEEDFVEMSKQSVSKNFVNAVDALLDEVAELVELKMLCPCMPKENLSGLDRIFAVNAGIKEGVHVPRGGVDKFPVKFFEPSHCLSMLRGFAKLSVLDNMLEFTVLKSWLSVFYRAKGGHQLPTYHDPQPIPGLDDDTRNLEVNSKFSAGEDEVGPLVPAEEGWLSSPVGPESQQDTQGLLQKCQEVPEDRMYQSRKQKSIAEIIGKSTDTKTENGKDDVTRKEATTSGKKMSTVERKKRKDRGENGDLKGKDDVRDLAKGSSSVRKKRKVGDEDDGKQKKKVVDESKSEASGSNPASVSVRSKRKGTNEVSEDAENTLSSKSRTKRTTKLSESCESADITISCLVKDGSRVQKSHFLRKGKKESSGAENGGSTGRKRKERKSKDVNGVEQERAANELASKGYLSRERKKSKYLSPPYTSVKRGQKEEMETESVKISSEAQLEERSSEAQLGKRMTRAASNLIDAPVQKPRDGTVRTKTARGRVPDHETSASGPGKPKRDEKKVFDPLNVKAPADKVLSRIRSAACNPLYVEGDDSLGKVDSFLSAFRISITLDGSKDKMYGQKQAGKQRMSKKSNPASSNKEQDPANSSSRRDKARQSKTRKMGGSKSDKSKEEDSTHANTSDGDVVEDPAALLVSFYSTSPLPTKDDLIKIYGKYGALKLEDTDMYYENQCARIMFLKSSEAEEAFNDSQLASPFPKARVNFRLQYLSNERKTRELKEISRSKSSRAKATEDPLAKPTASLSTEPSASEVSQLSYVKGKLADIAAMLETPDGKISPNVRSKVQGEIKHVLETVSTMIEPSS